MHSRLLGSSGRAVSAIGLGAMPLSLAGRPDEPQAIRVIHAALDAGLTLIDTADSYCLDDDDLGHNERLIGRALRDWRRREEVLVATKGGLERPGGDWTVNGRPEHLRRACERSLQALGVERIELYQLHGPDPAVPFEESVGALAELQRAGKIHHVGLSNVNVAQIELARTVVQVVSVQNRCNPFDRRAFLDGTVAYCTRHLIAFLPHSPVGGHRGHVRITAEPTLRRVADKLGVTPYQVGLAWLLASSPMMIPIPGASRAESARSSAAAVDLMLPPAQLEALNAAFPISPR
jgi:aryl-alcohol dehydrogenase-like predicted oxidoreductase